MYSLLIVLILMGITRSWTRRPHQPRPVVIPPWSERDPDELWGLALRDIADRMAPHYATR